MIVPVILSGGSGTRLWPLSTPERPKQFLNLVGDQSLFQATLSRVSDRTHYLPPVVVSNAAHRDLARDELAAHDGAQLILEPCARNTAAAIIMAAQTVRKSHGPEQLVLVMPSDHVIGDVQRFHAAVWIASAAAEAGRLVTFGIKPSGPETGYGYLQAGAAIEHAPGAFEVERFTEKPKLDKAQEMVATGRHYWNGGIFMFRAGDLLQEAERHAPEVYRSAIRAISDSQQEGSCTMPDLAALEPCPNISIDYAVMERSDRIAMVPLDANWSDVGTWDALAEVGLSSIANPNLTVVESENCYVRSDGMKVALVGVEDLIIVASSSQVLVMKRGRSQDIRDVVAQLTAND